MQHLGQVRLTSWRMAAELSIYWLSQCQRRCWPAAMVLGSYVLILLVFSRPPISSEKDLEILVLGQLRGRVSSKLSAQWHMRLQQRLMAKLPTTASFSGATNYLLLWMLRIHLSSMKGLLSAITIIFCHSNSKNAAVPALQLLPLNSTQIKSKLNKKCNVNMAIRFLDDRSVVKKMNGSSELWVGHVPG